VSNKPVKVKVKVSGELGEWWWVVRIPRWHIFAWRSYVSPRAALRAVRRFAKRLNIEITEIVEDE